MAKTAKPTHNSFAQTKETLGSIIFALIIALVFRGFVGQAFVIPSGSMGPTLSGAHIDHVCSACGFHFAVGTDRAVTRVTCPNCSHEDLLTSEQLVPDAGDGIFTLSWPFAIGGPLGPQRWDVVVFKAPFRIFASTDRDGETNYIKRLVGLPGDILEIIDGDLYQARAADLAEPIRAKLAHAPLPQRLTPDEQKTLDNLLHIARKTRSAQSALWQVVFDTDYLPTHPAPQDPKPAWKPVVVDPKQAHWTVAGPIFRFAGVATPSATQPADAAEPQYLELTGKDFRDNYGYNVDPARKEIVSDLRLSATVTWQAGDGRILLSLSKYDDLYTIELYPRQGAGRALLTKRGDPLQQQQEIQAWTFPAWKRNQPVRLSLASVDRQLLVQMNDRLAWQHDFPMTAAQAKQHAYETLPPIVRIGAADLKADFGHLLVDRDIYYQDWVDIQTYDSPTQKAHNQYTLQPGWATRGNPMLLRDKDYFVLGDNSPQSLDSRRWWQTGAHLAGRPDGYRVGTVPADQMIGRAFFVYWPSWYRLLNLRVIPNIGEMRWIQ